MIMFSKLFARFKSKKRKPLHRGGRIPKIPNKEMFVKESKVSPRALRKRVLSDELVPYVCQICGQKPIWKGKPMPLILDHINGVRDDNRLFNLRFVCSNCDTQLPTYKARNIVFKKDRQLRKKRIWR